MKKLFAVFAVILALSGCGGGGGGGGSGSTGSSNSTSSGGSDSKQVTSASSPANVVSVTVDSTYGFLNAPYVSVTVCAPGTTNCATIDHVMVDTGSVGLRLLRSALPASLGLANNADPVGGNTLAECTEFGSGHAWGPISTADLKIGGETASSLPFQIIDDSFASVPSDCASYGPDMAANGAQSMGANGILGVNVLRRDCLASCDTTADTLYYDCAGNSCNPVALPIADQLLNPVSQFATDNNGLTLTFPAVPSGGVSSVSGTMTFGINTQTNNTQASVTKLDTTVYGTVNATYNGQTLRGVIDSGSGAYFIPDATLNLCTIGGITWFCPSSTTTRTASFASDSGSPSFASDSGSQFPLQFDIVNAATELSHNVAAHAGIGQNVNLFGANLLDLGMPFFYGKSITFGLQGVDNMTSVPGDWPYFAVQS